MSKSRHTFNKTVLKRNQSEKTSENLEGTQHKKREKSIISDDVVNIIDKT